MPTFYIEPIWLPRNASRWRPIEANCANKAAQLAPTPMGRLRRAEHPARHARRPQGARRHPQTHAANPPRDHLSPACSRSAPPKELAVLPGVILRRRHSHTSRQIPNLLHAIALYATRRAQHAAPHLARLPHSGGLPITPKILTRRHLRSLRSSRRPRPRRGGEIHTRPHAENPGWLATPGVLFA